MNLFYADTATPTSNTSYKIINRNAIQVYNETAGSYKNAYVDIGILPAGTYSFSCLINKVSGANRVLIQTIAGGTATSIADIRTNSTQFTLNEESSLRFVFYSTESSATGDVTYSNIKVEQGEVASPYSPYNMGVATIEKCNKNLFDKNSLIIGKIPSVSTGELIDSDSSHATTDLIKINNTKNYILSGTTTNNSNIYIFYYRSDKTYISAKSFKGTINHLLNEDTEFANSGFVRIRIDDLTNTQNIQLEQNSQASTYVAHASQTYPIYTQQPMRAIGDVRDDFAKIGGVWYERHKIGKMVLNGTENWTYNGNSSRPFVLTVTNIVKPINNDTIPPLLSNYFIVDAWNTNVTSKTNNLSMNQSQDDLRFRNTATTSLADWKTRLSTHNTEVIHKLVEPTLLPCTSEQVEQLEALKDMEMYDEQTNITTLDVIQANLNFHYNFVTPAPSPDRESPIYSVADNNSINITVANEDETESQSFTVTTQQPFRKIDNVFDDFVKTNNVWYERHKIPKYTFTGEETITDHTTYATITISGMSINSVKSNYFSNGTNAGQINVSTANTLDIYYDDNIINATSLATFLTNNTVDLCYVASEPTLTPCTAAQAEQLEALQNILLYTGINHITNTNTPQATMVLEYDKLVEDYDFYVSTEGFFVVPKSNIKYQIDPIESNIPSMPEANETSVRLAGTDGDLPLMTTYEPLPFNIVCYTEDNLTLDEKVEEETKLNNFMNSIKNSTKQLVFETEEKLYDVKYNGALTIARYPKHIKFSIPLKSSKSYAKYFIERTVSGNATFESNTIKEVGPVFTILGPATNPRIALNNYQMYYDSSLLAGEKLIIDSGKSTVTLIDTNGDKFNAMGYYNHEFPKVKNGTNTLEVKAGITNASQLKMNWYDLKF